ncbi:MAG: hypothetical protein A2283_03070 [Lentisphaerae bacterium RIFOXYA12_FULL_48_11]|nr:MAG: hypothetical protein A2283_03070 [Lentisphaerae bacterium RIFOXYA12_FULL_48_11]
MSYDNNKENRITWTRSCEQEEDMCQIILYNDEHNEAFFVVRCLMQIFHHDTQLAIKIMMDAHTKGKAIAEVEGLLNATRHCDQLHSYGLTAEVMKI